MEGERERGVVLVIVIQGETSTQPIYGINLHYIVKIQPIKIM